MFSVKKYFRVDRRKIALIKFTLEAYEGVGLLTTVDSESGLVVISIPPGREMEVDTLISDLKDNILIEPVEGPL